MELTQEYLDQALKDLTRKKDLEKLATKTEVAQIQTDITAVKQNPRYPSLSGTFSRAGVKFNFIVTLVISTTYVAQMALNRPLRCSTCRISLASPGFQ